MLTSLGSTLRRREVRVGLTSVVWTRDLRDPRRVAIHDETSHALVSSPSVGLCENKVPVGEPSVGDPALREERDQERFRAFAI